MAKISLSFSGETIEEVLAAVRDASAACRLDKALDAAIDHAQELEADGAPIPTPAPAPAPRKRREKAVPPAKACAETVNGGPGCAPAPTESEPAAPQAESSHEAPVPAAPPVGSPTADELRAALRAFALQHGNDKAFDVLKKYNAEKISAVAPENWAGLLADLRA